MPPAEGKIRYRTEKIHIKICIIIIEWKLISDEGN